MVREGQRGGVASSGNRWRARWNLSYVEAARGATETKESLNAHFRVIKWFIPAVSRGRISMYSQRSKVKIPASTSCLTVKHSFVSVNVPKSRKKLKLKFSQFIPTGNRGQRLKCQQHLLISPRSYASLLETRISNPEEPAGPVGPRGL